MAEINDWVDDAAPVATQSATPVGGVSVPSAVPVSSPAASIDDWVDDSVPQNSISSRVAADKETIGNEAVDKLQNPNLNDLGRAAIDMHTGISGMMAYPKEAAISTYNALPDKLKDTVSSGLGSVKNAAVDAWNSLPQDQRERIAGDVKGLKDYVGGIAYDHPNVAAISQVLFDVLPAAGVTKGTIEGGKLIGSAAKTAAEGVEGLANKFVDKYPSGGPFDEWEKASSSTKSAKDVEAFNKQKANNTSYVEAMNDNAENMRKSYGKIYDKAQEASQGIYIDAPRMKNSVDSLLEDLNDDPAHKTSQGSSQAFRDLKAVSESFDDDGNIPLDKVTLLKRRVNDLYGPDMGETRGKIYAQLNEQLKNLTKRAKKDNPEWGTMMDSGNALFNNYRSTFDSPGPSNKAWSLADKKEYEDAHRARHGDPDTDMPGDPYSAPPSDDVREKIFNLHNVNSVAQYESMLRKLPPEMRDGFTRDVVAANKKKSPRLSAAIQTAYSTAKQNYGTALKNSIKVLKPGDPGFSPDMAENFPHVEDAIKYHSDIAEQAHKNYLDKLQKAQESPSSSGPLYLPAPERPMVGGRSKNPRPATDDEWQGIIDAQKRDNELGLNEVRKAQQKARISQYEAENPANNFFNKIGDKPIRPSQTALSPDTFEPGDHPFHKYNPDDTGFARGGAVVEKNPTPAQKMAGNYKKHHMRIHGLDISIENPKGSTRTGEGKDGKKWSSTMPDHYGYIKRTQGADGDHVDVYVGSNDRSNRVYVIDQKDPDTGSFDEHKVMIGYGDRDAATAAYRAAFSDKKNRIMKVTRLSVAEFKNWLKNGNTKQPVKKAV